jgi:hypothetical protein
MDLRLAAEICDRRAGLQFEVAEIAEASIAKCEGTTGAICLRVWPQPLAASRLRKSCGTAAATVGRPVQADSLLSR